MLRYAVALVLGVTIAAVSGLGVSNAADEKKAPTKTLEGKLVCTKCKLSETDACGNALQVTEKGKTVTYYIKDKGKKEKYHKCSGEQAAKVTGKVTEKDGKHYIENAKVVKE